MKIIIEKEDEGVRLDRYLRKKLKSTPLTEIFKAMRIGKIKVNNKKKKENYRLVEGDKVFIGLEMSEEDKKEEPFIKLSMEEIEELTKNIVFENDDIIIFNKKKDVVMHKGSGYDYGISEMFKSYFKNNNFNFVNRIDRKTSGLVIGAKNKIAVRELTEEIRENRIKKKYYVLVHGVISKKNFIIDNYLKKIEDSVVVTTKDDKDGKNAITVFKNLGFGSDTTLLEAELITGRTHQLRVQLADMGHPIVGDTRYGKRDNEKSLYLNSYYCEIPKYDIKIELPLSEYFKLRMKKNALSL